MRIEPLYIGIGAAILAAILAIYMPVSKRRANQAILAAVIVVLIFVAALTLLELQLALPVAVGVSVVVILARLVLGGVRSAIYHNFTRYLRRDYWQRKVGQSIVRSGRRGRRDDF